jgi:hypothetical protein
MCLESGESERNAITTSLAPREGTSDATHEMNADETKRWTTDSVAVALRRAALFNKKITVHVFFFTA